MTTELETEVRFLRASDRDLLCNILASNPDTWKSFMAKIPKSKTDPSPKYSTDDIRTIDTAAQQCNAGKNPMDILLDEWGTSGRQRPTIQDLANILRRDQLFARALYCVATDILGLESADEIPHDVAPNELFNGLPWASSEPPVLRSNPNETLELESLNDSEIRTMMTHLGDGEEGVEDSYQPDYRSIAGADVPRLNYSYLCDITANFCERALTEGGRKLGQGSFGSVYYGTMNGQLNIHGAVAVKRLNSTSDRLEVRFNAEIECMRYALHDNILQLLAYSNDGAYQCLVYEYMENGNLADRLALKSDPVPLTGVQRLQIALGAAQGLAYLHNHSHEKSLVHRDVKPENILLNRDLVPKLSDFGLVRLTGAGDFDRSIDQTSLMMGTPLYMAPEAMRGEISDKIDVYSFGVVLLEMLTSVPALGDHRTENNNLLSYWQEVEDRDPLIDPVFLVDRSISHNDWGKIADRCLESLRKKRPNMETVFELLNNLYPVSLC
eukprot:TRINITY_DN1199_c0_g1_i23.p1 TRINITY_DN1199_c0_g1~~TRINITY_DN1199_c0_g1_i23.p1  ORF type:complete len:496 (-),score=90.01 TRINITY_DN1199_c0_g1_i23:362-1849(-)